MEPSLRVVHSTESNESLAHENLLSSGEWFQLHVKERAFLFSDHFDLLIRQVRWPPKPDWYDDGQHIEDCFGPGGEYGKSGSLRGVKVYS